MSSMPRPVRASRSQATTTSAYCAPRSVCGDHPHTQLDDLVASG